jgi:hypothetical protein
MVRMWFKAADVPADVHQPALVRLGGLTAYSDDQAALEENVEKLSDIIVECSKEHLIAPRDVIRHVVEQKGADVRDRRFFNAVLGRCLRFGRLDTLACGNRQKPFTCVIHPESHEEVENLMAASMRRLCGQRDVRVTELRDELFPRKEWGTWFVVQNALSRLVFLGLAVAGAKGEFAKSEAMNCAVSEPGWQLPDLPKRWWLG